MRERYVVRMDFVLDSKDGLLRDGPQCVGWRRPSWMSMRTRAVLGRWDDIEDVYTRYPYSQ